MKHYIHLIILILLLLINISVATAAEDNRVLPVLVYHHIQDPVKSDVSCTPSMFEAHMIALKDAGFTPITIPQTRSFLAGTLTQSIKKPVLITFDDGYESLYKYALPVSVKLRVPMTVFIITSRIGQKPQFSAYLTESQIKEMNASGLWYFGSHSHNLHTESTKIYNAFGGGKVNPLLDELRADLVASSKCLENITGVPTEIIAWPYGKFNSEYTAIARLVGYKMHFTSLYGYNEPGTNPYSIKRIPVSARDTGASVVKKCRGRQR